ncbi:MAG: flagellar basal body-associated FliL family protein [Clostridia bacterium]|nr:flagellar basal body-associated FliL family protein [Clostridia bacterium]
MEGKGSFFNIVLLLIVAFLTLTLAALAGYVFLGGGSKTTEKVVEKAHIEVPKDEDLVSLTVFEEGKPELFNLKNENKDSGVLPVIQVSIELEYFKKAPKGSSIKDTALKVQAYQKKIKELIGTYFMNRTLEEVKQPDAKKKAAEELKKAINELINENEEDKKDIIYEITFEKWFYS